MREPSTVVRARKYRHLKISGLHADLTERLIKRLEPHLQTTYREFHDLHSLPIHVQIENSAHRHAGFGTGTQIAFAVAAAVFHSLDMPLPDVKTLARLMDRGLRSAIGSYGFYRGGCIVDRGKTAREPVSELETRLDFPTSWPVILIRPREKSGLNGQFESEAFEKLCGDTSANRERLVRLCRESLVPAVIRDDYDAFAETLFEFNRISGEYFAGFQQGVYNGTVCSQIVKDVRRFGVAAAGQSSWGPCIFAIASHDVQARELVSHLRMKCPAVGDDSQTEIIVTVADNSGMKICNNSLEAPGE